MNLDSEYIRSLIDYDPNTGICTWKPRSRELFANNQAFSTWNTRFSGKRAGSYSTDRRGYRCRTIRIKNKLFLEHRLIWMVMTGKEPPSAIDHINRDGTDNRWCNLRDAGGDNNLNMSKRSDNKSGVTGVSWNKNANMWSAYVNLNGNRTHLGYFNVLEEAATAVKQARQELGFSEHHGNDRTYDA